MKATKQTFWEKARSCFHRFTNKDLDRKLDQIIMTQKELATKLAELTAQEGKVAKEQSDRFDAVSAALKAQPQPKRTRRKKR